jgi:hypothetical protein
MGTITTKDSIQIYYEYRALGLSLAQTFWRAMPESCTGWTWAARTKRRTSIQCRLRTIVECFDEKLRHPSHRPLGNDVRA